MKYFLNLVNKLWIILFLVLMTYLLLTKGSTYPLSKNLILICIIPITLGPLIIRKVLHYNMSETLKFFYFLFIMIALICGSVLEWYHSISWFDLFAHFLSGIISSIAALIILKQCKILQKENFLFSIIFMLCFTLAVASCWEFFEFGADKVLGGDAQWVQKTGVDDTMTDMLIALLGNILFDIYCFFMMKKDSKKFMKTLEHIL